MAYRKKVNRKYSKKIFRKTSGIKRKGNVRRPHQRGGWRM